MTEMRDAELQGVLRRVFGQTPGRILQQQLNPPHASAPVLRVCAQVDNLARSLIVKRLRPDVARRCELAATRWLPAVGLHHGGPELLGAMLAPDGRSVWHVYEDVGDWPLDGRSWDEDAVRLVVELIARVHTGFADRALLGECRWYGEDFGISFYAANVRDATRALEALHPPDVELSAAQSALRDRLLKRLRTLRNDQPRRAQVMREWGGPETLLHGDLWTSNTFICPTASGLRPVLIDWDHVGVGPVSYDLSTFLYRFPAERRHCILDVYRGAVRDVGWRLPTDPQLNLLFDTAECARYANRAMWGAVAVVYDKADWGFAELAEVEQWFDALQPVLP